LFTFDFTGEFAAFFILSAVMICGAVLMISLEKVVHMVISMAAVFLGLGGMFVLLEAEFVAFVQVLIYAGAVSILMIFGIMMTRHQPSAPQPRSKAFEALAAIGVLCLFGIMFYAIRQTSFPERGALMEAGEDNTMAIGELLYSGYVIPFELLSVLLTVAFIGAIVIAKKEAD